jgi:hypothetical protein
LLEIRTLTCSTRSKKTSFFLCLMPSFRQPTAPVTVKVAFCACAVWSAWVEGGQHEPMHNSISKLATSQMRTGSASERTPFWKMNCFSTDGSVSCGNPKSMTSSSSSYMSTKLFLMLFSFSAPWK